MPASDPLTETRRERFRAYCRKKGWFDEGRQQWTVTEIARATLKPTNKVSDLLNGKGTFGAKIARELEIAMGLQVYELESAEEIDPDQHKGSSVANFDPLQRPSVALAMEVLGEALSGLDDLGFRMAEPVIKMLMTDPLQARDLGAELQRLTETRKRPPPGPPKGPKRHATPTQAAASHPTKAKLSVTAGGGQRSLLDKPISEPLKAVLTPSLDPFNESNASPAEREWYKTMDGKPRARG